MADTYPICRLVTAPDETAPILHDLATGVRETTWINSAADNFSLGEPAWSTGSAGII